MPQFSGDHQFVSVVDKICRANNRRRVKEFFNYGSAQAAADVLDDAETVMLLTGFCVKQDGDGKPVAETDGPAGTVILEQTLARVGKDVVLVVDEVNSGILQYILHNQKSEFKDISARVQVKVWKSGHDAPDVLKRFSPDLVGAVEVPGRNVDGVYCNMKGEAIGSFNVDLDSILIEARAQGVRTFAVGDGGNEAGMAGLNRLDQLEPSHFVSIVPSDMAVTAWNSNLGAMAIAGCFNVQADGGAIDPEVYKQAVELSVAAGAIDGVTGLAKASVDGAGMERHLGDIEALNEALNLH